MMDFPHNHLGISTQTMVRTASNTNHDGISTGVMSTIRAFWHMSRPPLKVTTKIFLQKKWMWCHSFIPIARTLEVIQDVKMGVTTNFLWEKMGVATV